MEFRSESEGILPRKGLFPGEKADRLTCIYFIVGKGESMAITIYCKACEKDVPEGEHCPFCGGALKASGRHVVWSMAHYPVLDWLKWNEAGRILLPAYGVLGFLLLMLEAASRGAKGVEGMLSGGFLVGGMTLLVLTILGVGTVLLLQGRDVVDVEVDSKGVHHRVYLPQPTALKLLFRLKPLSMMAQGAPILLISQRDVPWRDVARVQLWPEKTMVLLYAPFWYLRLGIQCDPFQYEDVLFMAREKLGRKRNVLLPSSLQQPAAPRKPRSRHSMPEAMSSPPDSPEDSGFPM